MTEALPENQRTIKSYVVRQGRVSKAQKRALGSLDAYQINLQKLPEEAKKPWVFDIGFGVSATFVSMAKENPDFFFVGAEVYPPALGSAVLKIEEKKTPNVLLHHGDAIAFLEDFLATGGKLSRVQIFFPDPWPKKKHHKRRLIQKDFLEQLKKALHQGGEIHIATDWEPYAAHIKEVFQNSLDFSPSESSLKRERTNFENKGRKAEREVFDLVYKRQ